jgi:hypothetical protein
MYPKRDAMRGCARRDYSLEYKRGQTDADTLSPSSFNAILASRNPGREIQQPLDEWGSGLHAAGFGIVMACPKVSAPKAVLV